MYQTPAGYILSFAMPSVRFQLLYRENWNLSTNQPYDPWTAISLYDHKGHVE